MMRTAAILGIHFTLVTLGIGVANAETIVVPGTSNPFLAGQGDSATYSGGDTVPLDSPVDAGVVTPGGSVSFSDVTGFVSYNAGGAYDGPNGEAGYPVTDSADYNIAGYTDAPLDSLVGVFLPSAGPPPAIAGLTALNLSTPTTSPGLQQVFFIGDGSLGSVTVPVGATRLFLGTIDGFQWNNNLGAFDLTVTGVTGVPESSTWALLLLGFAGVGFAGYRRAGCTRASASAEA